MGGESFLLKVCFLAPVGRWLDAVVSQNPAQTYRMSGDFMPPPGDSQASSLRSAGLSYGAGAWSETRGSLVIKRGKWGKGTHWVHESSECVWTQYSTLGPCLSTCLCLPNPPPQDPWLNVFADFGSGALILHILVPILFRVPRLLHKIGLSELVTW